MATLEGGSGAALLARPDPGREAAILDRMRT
jgi:hypothetical protein